MSSNNNRGHSLVNKNNFSKNKNASSSRGMKRLSHFFSRQPASSSATTSVPPHTCQLRDGRNDNNKEVEVIELLTDEENDAESGSGYGSVPSKVHQNLRSTSTSTNYQSSIPPPRIINNRQQSNNGDMEDDWNDAEFIRAVDESLKTFKQESHPENNNGEDEEWEDIPDHLLCQAVIDGENDENDGGVVDLLFGGDNDLNDEDLLMACGDGNVDDDQQPSTSSAYPSVSSAATTAVTSNYWHPQSSEACGAKGIGGGGSGTGSVVLDEIAGFDCDAGRTWLYPTKYPIRDYQRNIVQRALFNNTMVCLPTGLGKTLIAAVVIFNIYRWYPGGKIVFLAPSRPLVAQQISACYKVMGIPQEDMVELTGARNPMDRKEEWIDKRVFFMTAQTMTSDLERGSCPVQDIRCLVVDEAHRATGQHAYCQVVQYLRGVQSNFRVLALSATPGSDNKNIQQVIDNLLISKMEVRTEQSLDVAPYLQGRVNELKVVKLTPLMLEFKDALERVIHPESSQYILVEFIQPADDENLKMWQMFDGLTNALTKLQRLGALNSNNLQYFNSFKILLISQKFQAAPNVKGQAMRLFGFTQSLYSSYDLLMCYGLRTLYAALKAKKKEKSAYVTLMTYDPPLKWIIDKLEELYAQLRDCSLDKSMLLAGSMNSTSYPQAPDAEEDNENEEEENIEKAETSHPKLFKLREILTDHFTAGNNNNIDGGGQNRRVMVFSSYRNSVADIVDYLQRFRPILKPAEFKGQSSGQPRKAAGRRRSKAKAEAASDGPNGKTAADVNDNNKKGKGRPPKRKSDPQKTDEANNMPPPEDDQSTEAQKPNLKRTTQKRQLETVESFKDGKFNILVSTSVGEEGLDIGDVDLIVNYDAPKSSIRTTQRCGRTGRAKEGKVIWLLTEKYEERMYHQSVYNKKRVRKDLVNDKIYQFYDQNPRMVPRTVHPKFVEYVHTESKPFDPTMNRGGKKRKSEVRGEQADKKSKRKTGHMGGYLNDAEMTEYQGRYRITPALQNNNEGDLLPDFDQFYPQWLRPVTTSCPGQDTLLVANRSSAVHDDNNLDNMDVRISETSVVPNENQLHREMQQPIYSENNRAALDNLPKPGATNRNRSRLLVSMHTLKLTKPISLGGYKPASETTTLEPRKKPSNIETLLEKNLARSSSTPDENSAANKFKKPQSTSIVTKLFPKNVSVKKTNVSVKKNCVPARPTSNNNNNINKRSKNSNKSVPPVVKTYSTTDFEIIGTVGWSLTNDNNHILETENLIAKLESISTDETRRRKAAEDDDRWLRQLRLHYRPDQRKSADSDENESVSSDCRRYTLLDKLEKFSAASRRRKQDLHSKNEQQIRQPIFYHPGQPKLPDCNDENDILPNSNPWRSSLFSKLEKFSKASRHCRKFGDSVNEQRMRQRILRLQYRPGFYSSSIPKLPKTENSIIEPAKEKFPSTIDEFSPSNSPSPIVKPTTPDLIEYEQIIAFSNNEPPPKCSDILNAYYEPKFMSQTNELPKESISITGSTGSRISAVSTKEDKEPRVIDCNRSPSPESRVQAAHSGTVIDKDDISIPFKITPAGHLTPVREGDRIHRPIVSPAADTFSDFGFTFDYSPSSSSTNTRRACPPSPSPSVANNHQSIDVVDEQQIGDARVLASAQQSRRRNSSVIALDLVDQFTGGFNFDESPSRPAEKTLTKHPPTSPMPVSPSGKVVGDSKVYSDATEHVGFNFDASPSPMKRSITPTTLTESSRSKLASKSDGYYTRTPDIDFGGNNQNLAPNNNNDSNSRRTKTVAVVDFGFSFDPSPVKRNNNAESKQFYGEEDPSPLAVSSRRQLLLANNSPSSNVRGNNEEDEEDDIVVLPSPPSNLTKSKRSNYSLPFRRRF